MNKLSLTQSYLTLSFVISLALSPLASAGKLYDLSAAEKLALLDEARPQSSAESSLEMIELPMASEWKDLAFMQIFSTRAGADLLKIFTNSKELSHFLGVSQEASFQLFGDVTSDSHPKVDDAFAFRPIVIVANESLIKNLNGWTESAEQALQGAKGKASVRSSALYFSFEEYFSKDFFTLFTLRLAHEAAIWADKKFDVYSIWKRLGIVSSFSGDALRFSESLRLDPYLNLSLATIRATRFESDVAKEMGFETDNASSGGESPEEKCLEELGLKQKWVAQTLFHEKDVSGGVSLESLRGKKLAVENGEQTFCQYFSKPSFQTRDLYISIRSSLLAHGPGPRVGTWMQGPESDASPAIVLTPSARQVVIDQKISLIRSSIENR